jgi:hypothetical protein
VRREEGPRAQRRRAAGVLTAVSTVGAAGGRLTGQASGARSCRTDGCVPARALCYALQGCVIDASGAVLSLRVCKSAKRVVVKERRARERESRVSWLGGGGGDKPPPACLPLSHRPAGRAAWAFRCRLAAQSALPACPDARAPRHPRAPLSSRPPSGRCDGARRPDRPREDGDRPGRPPGFVGRSRRRRPRAQRPPTARAAPGQAARAVDGAGPSPLSTRSASTSSASGCNR